MPAHLLERVLTALPQHIELTRAEPGCLLFEVVESEGELIVHERFVDREAFGTHQHRTQTSVWADITKDCERDYQIVEI